MQDRRVLGCLILALLATSGCASIIQGSNQRVYVVTEPSGAGLELDGMRVGQTPANVRIKRGKTHLVKISKAGYEDRTLTMNSSVNGGWVILDVLCGVIPLVVDIANSNWESFESPMYLTLQQHAAAQESAASNPSPDGASTTTQPAAAQLGELVLEDRSRTQLFDSSSYVTCKIQRGWHVREVELRFDGPVHAGMDPLGPFTKLKVSSAANATFFIRSDNGPVYRMTFGTVSGSVARLEWVKL